MAIQVAGQKGLALPLQKLLQASAKGAAAAQAAAGQQRSALESGTPADRQKAVREQLLKRSDEELKKLQEQLEQNKEQEKIKKEATENHLKCMKIASRLMAGDEVPLRDIRFLMKNNMELYAKAITLRIKKAKPKKHKPLTKPREGENQQTEAAKSESISVSGEGNTTGDTSGGGEGGGSEGGGESGGASGEGSGTIEL